ncbi:TolC family protein [Pseudomonadota bacterium]
MNLSRLMIVLMATFASESVLAQSITLNEYLSSVRSNHPFFAKETISSEIERLQQESHLGDEDWVISASPFFHHEERRQGSAFAARKQDHISASVGVERTYWSNGSRVALIYDYNRLNQSFEQPIGVIDEHTMGVRLTYSMPLLKNKDGILNRLNYELQAYNIDLAGVIALENQEDFLAENGQLFLGWVFVAEQHLIASNRLTLAEEELARTEKKRQSRLVAEVDVLRARDAVITAKQGVQRIVAMREAVTTELATLSGESAVYEAQPQFDLYALAELPEIDQVVSMLHADSRLLKSVDLQLAQLKHHRSGLENELEPELDLVMSGGLRRDDDEFFDSARVDQPQYSIGFNFRYPLGQRRAKSGVSKARLQQQQLRLERNNLGRQLEAALRNTLVQLKQFESVLELSREQVDVARLRTEAELKRHNQGRSELTFVIQSRDNEQNAQLSYAENALSYQRLLLLYASLTDSLLEEGE